ncbi:Tetratricopeptide repeat-containing protein [Loktanella fryxellensis]|uniref:Tetratricopeptide repeat-containing protein n=1 Tax=Loktanella fryxellensis TaxID=245187 RepID=A0A1H8FPN9_9RHOB|nr:tetratricopeptide repeat protein [Loktanella fryxellensis]SEN33761.1 Tetratricopeptide repeat-containing protein [Loktanella fryxellensis]
MKRLIPLGAALCVLMSGHMLHAQPSDTSDPGAYLAAANAARTGDFAAAAQWFTEALGGDPGNPQMLESLAVAQVALGDFEAAEATAQTMRLAGFESQVGNKVLAAVAAARDEWATIQADLAADHTVSPLFDGLVLAWALVGSGDMTAALAAFDTVTATDGMAAYGQFHKALALGSVGDHDGALAILSASGNGSAGFGPRATIAHAQVLSQLGRNADALAVLDDAFGATLDPAIVALRNQLAADGAVPFDVVTGARDGVAETAFMIASLLATEAEEAYTLQYARVAQYLTPGSADAALLSAELLQNLNRFDLAGAAFASVAQDDPNFVNAELGRVDALRRAGDVSVAVEVAQALARATPDLPFVHARLGDMLNDADDRPGAIAAYSRALDLYSMTDPTRWIVHYTRAIAYHASDMWPEAESDFRAALAIEPDQPQVLNYLGYSLVERGEKLDEALDMIERAVADAPDSGAIVDSLGWVYFRLGRYAEAVGPLERAAELEAADPTINDHLGDAYWAVGRVREAQFQWQRALSFEPDADLATRIRAKLERGLDAVLADEGQPPLSETAAEAEP